SGSRKPLVLPSGGPNTSFAQCRPRPSTKRSIAQRLPSAQTCTSYQAAVRLERNDRDAFSANFACNLASVFRATAISAGGKLCCARVAGYLRYARDGDLLARKRVTWPRYGDRQ